MSDKLRVCDINGLMRRAEHEICNAAKHAIGAYYPLWQAGTKMDFAKFYTVNCYLRPCVIPECKRLMAEFGMTDDATSEGTQLQVKLDRFNHLLQEEKKSNALVNEMRRFHSRLVKDRKKAHDEYIELKKKLENGK